MASDVVVRRAVRAMAAATGQRFYTEEDEATAVITFAGALVDYSDDAVNLAADEWARTMPKFPALVEFVTLVRRFEAELRFDERELGVGGMAPEQRYPIGRAGHENVAARIVLERMLDAVAREAPLGYLGRARGYTSDKQGASSQRELGHTHMDGGDCARCHAIATVAWEQLVEFADSEITWEQWESAVTDAGLRGLRRCANASCEYGWVTKIELDGSQRVEKCETCGGPQPKIPKKERPEGTTVVRRRRRGGW